MRSQGYKWLEIIDYYITIRSGLKQYGDDQWISKNTNLGTGMHVSTTQYQIETVFFFF